MHKINCPKCDDIMTITTCLNCGRAAYVWDKYKLECARCGDWFTETTCPKCETEMKLRNCIQTNYYLPFVVAIISAVLGGVLVTLALRYLS
jgi:hypothetical protein